MSQNSICISCKSPVEGGLITCNMIQSYAARAREGERVGGDDLRALAVDAKTLDERVARVECRDGAELGVAPRYAWPNRGGQQCTAFHDLRYVL